jgi:tetratricopeptide (TPR) repeat protein
VCLAGSAAFAEAPKKAQRAAARQEADDVARARKLFADAQTAYDLQEFSKALNLYSEAYRVKALPGFLFNMAQCQKQLGDLKSAAFFFGRFIDNSRPDAPNVELARDLLKDLNAKLDEQAAEQRRSAESRRAADESKESLDAKRREDSDRAAVAGAPARAVDVPVRAVDVSVVSVLEPSASGGAAPMPAPLVEANPWYKSGWFWGVVGVGVAAGVSAVAVWQWQRAQPTLGTINARPH